MALDDEYTTDCFSICEQFLQPVVNVKFNLFVKSSIIDYTHIISDAVFIEYCAGLEVSIFSRWR